MPYAFALIFWLPKYRLLKNQPEDLKFLTSPYNLGRILKFDSADGSLGAIIRRLISLKIWRKYAKIARSKLAMQSSIRCGNRAWMLRRPIRQNYRILMSRPCMLPTGIINLFTNIGRATSVQNNLHGFLVGITVNRARGDLRFTRRLNQYHTFVSKLELLSYIHMH